MQGIEGRKEVECPRKMRKRIRVPTRSDVNGRLKHLISKYTALRTKIQIFRWFADSYVSTVLHSHWLFHYRYLLSYVRPLQRNQTFLRPLTLSFFTPFPLEYLKLTRPFSLYIEHCCKPGICAVALPICVYTPRIWVYAPRRHQPRPLTFIPHLNPSLFQHVPRWFGWITFVSVQ